MGEQKPSLVVPLDGPFIVTLGIPDLDAHLLQVEQPVPRLAGHDEVHLLAEVAVVVLPPGFGQLLSRHPGYARDVYLLPMIEAGAHAAASPGGRFVDQADRRAAPGGGDGCETPGKTATKDDHIRTDLVLDLISQGVWPA